MQEKLLHRNLGILPVSSVTKRPTGCPEKRHLKRQLEPVEAKIEGNSTPPFSRSTVRHRANGLELL